MSEGVTELLQRWSEGDPVAGEAVIPLVYEELRRIAARQFQRERADHTLSSTAVVHEAFLRLAGDSQLAWPSRAHFFAFAAHLMRRLLVDHARVHNRAKRGGEAQRVALTEALEVGGGRHPDLVALDEALCALGALEPQRARIVELRFFGGLSQEEIADQLGVSVETVGRQWRRAKAWLYRELKGAP